MSSEVTDEGDFHDQVDDATLRARAQLTSRLNVVINRFADRDDLLLFCLWRAPGEGEAPAWYEPGAGRVTLNAHVGLQGALPGEVNPLTRAGRRRHPQIIGLLAHEASHAHSTDMSAEALEFRKRVQAEDPILLEVMTLLEEPRIEYRQVQRRPHDRYYLRAQSVMIDLAPFSVDAAHAAPALDRWRAASVALLVYGRADAGILTAYDAQHVRPSLVESLGEEDFEKLRAVQLRATRVEDGDLEGLLECSRQWLDIVGRPRADVGIEDLLALLVALFGCDAGMPGGTGEGEWANTPDEEGGTGDGGEHGSESGVDEDDGGGPEVLSELGGGLKDLASEVATEVADEAAAQDAEEAAHSAGQQSAKDRTAEAKQKARQEKVAASVFDPDKGSLPALKGTRPPTSDERRLAREVGLALKRAQFRDRTTTRHISMTPPGRLNGRDAMLGEAQRSMGQIVTARPFRTKRTRHAPEPPITLGLLADYSGSMGWASGALASVAWVCAHSMSYVTGTMASALFAEKVVPLTRPGEMPAQVQEYAANGGWENFGRAYAAINGALNLTRGQGVRVLVVLSDGCFVNAASETEKVEAMRELKRAGVTVLWAGVPGMTTFPEDTIPVPLLAVQGQLIQANSHLLAGAITRTLADTLRGLP